MSEAFRRVQEAARDASSGNGPEIVWDENDMAHSLDEETLDERSSTQMGEMYESRRIDAND